MQLFFGLLIPFLGTTLGSAMVFFMKNKINEKVEKILLGFIKNQPLKLKKSLADYFQTMKLH